MKGGDYLSENKEISFGAPSRVKAKPGRFGDVVGDPGSGNNWTTKKPPGFPSKNPGESDKDYANRTGAKYQTGSPDAKPGTYVPQVMQMFYPTNWKQLSDDASYPKKEGTKKSGSIGSSETTADPKVGRQNTGLSEAQIRGRAAAEAYEKEQADKRASQGQSSNSPKKEVSLREQKQNQEQGSGGKDQQGNVKDLPDRRTGKSGSNAGSKVTGSNSRATTTKPVVGKDVGMPNQTGTAKPGSKSSDSMSFSEAFAKARKEQGPGGTFTWQGKKYTTDRADDKKPAPVAQAKSKTATTLPVNKPKQELQGNKPAVSKPTPKSNPGAGSGMGVVEREGALNKELSSLKTSSESKSSGTPLPDRRARKTAKKAVKKATRKIIKDTRKSGRVMRKALR